MRLRHIEVFNAIYTSGSITGAAKLLNVSQPSVSKVLAHAEQQIGFKLFDRSGSKLTPTPEAERLFPHVGQVFTHLAQVKRVAANLRAADQGSIRLACTPALGMALAPQLVAKFIDLAPNTIFDIETLHIDAISQSLAESHNDLALAFDPPAQPGLRVHPVATGRFVVIAPSNLGQDLGATTSLNKLAQLPFISLNTRGPLGQLLDAHLRDAGAAPNVVATAETYHLAHALVAQGAGIAVVDEITARSSQFPGVRIIELEPVIEFQISALYLESPPLPLLAQRFLEFAEAESAAFLTTPLDA